MLFTISSLKEHSNLPGPRANLELLYDFANSGNEKLILECLELIEENTENSPEEFVGMCGVLGYAVLFKKNLEKLLPHWKRYASHRSWRIREAVAMGIQETSVGRVAESLSAIGSLLKDNSYELRAVVAGFCEPKLLSEENDVAKILDCLLSITQSLDISAKLDAGQKALKKALGYGWSVVVASCPPMGKRAFEALFSYKGSPIQWIIQENLKKKRLETMDSLWVEECKRRLT